MSARDRRFGALDRLDGGSVDLLVAGAGIVGSRIAYEAARHGMTVALVDAGDFGGATSSASSKLVHGGLRYLASGDVGLVRRLAVERHVLMALVAPHLIRPLPLVIAAGSDKRSRGIGLVAALALYGAIARSRDERPSVIHPAIAQRLVPSLAPEGVSVCGVVHEAQTDDARLVLATVRGAERAGAFVLNHVRLDAFEHVRGRIAGAALRDLDTGRELGLRCSAAVNATGPWVDRIRLLDDPAAHPIARLSRGVQAMLRLDRPWRAGVALFDTSRTAIAVPWQGLLLVGATDAEQEGDPASAEPTPAELAEVLAPLAGVIRDDALDPRRIVSTMAGTRVLPRGPGATSKARRSHLLDVGETGLVSVAGGKLTTHRSIALDALGQLPPELRLRRIAPATAALPGAGGAVTLPGGLAPETARHLMALYGSEAVRVLAYAEREPDALEPIDDRGPDVLAQAFFARDEEHALTVDDVVRRRTTLAIRGLADDRTRSRVARVLHLDHHRRHAGLAELAIR